MSDRYLQAAEAIERRTGHTILDDRRSRAKAAIVSMAWSASDVALAETLFGKPCHPELGDMARKAVMGENAPPDGLRLLHGKKLDPEDLRHYPAMESESVTNQQAALSAAN